MDEEEEKVIIEKARAALPLPSAHEHDIILILVSPFMRSSFLEGPISFKKGFYKVYFIKEKIAGIVSGWTFHKLEKNELRKRT